MNSVYCSWSDEEIIALFKKVEQGILLNKKLLDIFAKYAYENNRKTNSVRNYYYLEIKELIKNADKLKRLKINLDKHKPAQQKYFSEEESSRLFENISKMKSQGYSVRKACHKLAGGDLDLMIRYQNKYRNLYSTTSHNLQNISKLNKNKNFSDKLDISKNKDLKNIIYMPQKNHSLSESDIDSLFLGLVRLVKKCALDNAEQNLKSEAEFANDTLRKVLVKLSGRETKIKTLNEQNQQLKKENLKLFETVNKLRCERVENIKTNFIDTKKISNLKKYIKQIGKQIKTPTKVVSQENI